MTLTKNPRGFPVITHNVYPPGPVGRVDDRLVQESSAIGNYDDSFDKPGSSYLWVGQNHHLNREEVAELVTHLNRWLETGSLSR